MWGDPAARPPRDRREWVGLAIDVAVVVWCIVGIMLGFIAC